MRGVKPSRRRVPVPIRLAIDPANVNRFDLVAPRRRFKLDSISDFEL